MSEELRPCPFCGSDAMLFDYDYWQDGKEFYYIECENNDVCAGKQMDVCSYESAEDAIKAWNTRIKGE